MYKSLKVLATVGLSTMLLATAALPSAQAVQSPLAVKYSEKVPYSKAPKKEAHAKYSEDSFVIKYKEPLSVAEHKASGGTQIRHIKQLKYAVIKVKNKKNMAKVMKKYAKLGKVESISPSAVYSLQSMPDPKAGQQYQHEMLQTEKAQKLAGKNPVTVAVIDMGTDTKHPDLKGSLLPGYNIGNPANEQYPMDHGTHVSGIIAAKKGNGEGGYGVASNVKILPIDVLDGNNYYLSDYILAEGILKAVEKGAKVINMSLGMGVYSPLTDAAIQTANEKGVVVVAAAGNGGSDYISYPAGNEGVISVGSVNKDKKLSYFSTYGPSMDIVAPGEDVYSTMYDGSRSSYEYMSGTSMASPMIAAVSALLLTKYPKLTPGQVEYILEQTADDLGDKGFDVKYAHGLVNPVKALSFDMKKLPSYVKDNWTKEEILKKAAKVDGGKAIVKEGSITKPFEQQWIQFEVKKGEYIQTSLKGSKMYDYKIMTHFYGAGKNETSIQEVNATQDGTMEAGLIQAPFDGTVAIGVKDVNNNYDGSSKKASKYTLAVSKADGLPADESTIDQMEAIPSIPYKQPTPFHLAGDEGDYDYFTVTADKDELVRISMSAVGGLNTDVAVYNLTEMFGGEEGEEIPEETKKEMLKQLLESEFAYSHYANANGASEGETLTFEAAAKNEYIIQVGGNATDYNDFYMEYDLNIGTEEKKSSLLPYTIELTSKQLPEDEDGLDYEVLAGEEDSETIEEVPEGDPLSSIFSIAEDEEDGEDGEDSEEGESNPVLEEQNRMVETVMESARPFEDMNKGYVQNGMDLDAYLIESDSSGIHELNIANKDGLLPYVTVLEYKEYEDGDDVYKVLEEQSANVNINMSTFEMELSSKLHMGLKEGKQYIVLAESNPFSEGNNISFEPYSLSSKRLVADPEDAFEPNDEEAVELPGSTFQANFAMPNDMDTYYYKANETAVKAISIATNPVTDALKKKFPAELLNSYYGYAYVYEDSNGNKKLDGEDKEIQNIIKGPLDFTSGSFQSKKGKGYFIATFGALTSYEGSISVIPHTINVVTVNRKDASRKTRPVMMKKETSRLSTISGHFDPGITGGDDDWYQFIAPKDAPYRLKLEAGKEIDGIIEVYQNNKLIRKYDAHYQSDNEEFVMNLKKGKYNFKVTDANGSSSITPYKLKVYMH